MTCDALEKIIEPLSGVVGITKGKTAMKVQFNSTEDAAQATEWLWGKYFLSLSTFFKIVFPSIENTNIVGIELFFSVAANQARVTLSMHTFMIQG